MVARKGAEPLMARESTAARMTSRMASNGVLCVSERLWPNRTIINVARKMMIPRKEI
jgi:hypothetical protein